MSAGTEITTPAFQKYSPAQVNLIRNTVAKACETEMELGLFLETCARNLLDPFTKQVWAIKLNGTVQTVVSRDGLLSIANRHTPDGMYHVNGAGMFQGAPSGVIREFDVFDFQQIDREDGTTQMVVEHGPRDKDGKKTHGGKDGSLRGPIVASWCRVKRLGHDDSFFMAYWAEYAKTIGVWKTHPTAMMQKCAESMALRKAFSVTGVIGEGEGGDTPIEVLSAVTTSEKEIEWPEDTVLAQALKDRFEARGYSKAKIRLLVNGASIEALHELVETMDAESPVDATVVA